MKYIKSLESLNEARSTRKYKSAGKLGYNDQFLGRDSLSQTLAEDLDGMDVGFDHISLYDVNTGETIMDDALIGKYTYDQILKTAEKWYKNHKMYKESKEDFEPHMMYDPKTGKGYKADTYEDHIRMDKMGYVHEKPEKVDEAKKFKPGDMWSNDFDYDGMLKYALKVNEKTPIKTLNALFDSATDVNYHTPFRNLGIAIDWIEDGDVKGAKDYIKMFHKDIKNEIKSQS